MTVLSPPIVRSKSTPPTDVDALHELAERLNSRPVPGVVMTERQFLDWCPEKVRAEWVDGEVILMPPDDVERGDVNLLLAAVVRFFVEHHELGRVLGSNVGIRLPEARQLRAPDLSFVTSARAHLIRKTYLDGPPDLALEIVSPDSVDRDWHTKYQEYERAGVREYWIADPRHQRFAAHTLRGKGYRPLPVDDDGRVHSKVLKGFFVRPQWLWKPTTLAAVLKELGL